MKRLLTLAASVALITTLAFGQEIKPKKPTISKDSEMSIAPRDTRPIRGRVADARPNNRQPFADHENGKRMTFQGSLFQNGEAFDGTADLTFTIEFDSINAWTETHEAVTVINGLYSVTLGQFNPMPRALFFFADEREMQVEVNGTILGRVKLYAPFESRSNRDNFVLLFDQEGVPKAEMSVWAGQGFLNVDGPDDRSNAILSGNFYGQDSSALNHGMLALYGPSNGPGEPDHLRVELSSRGDGTSNGANPFMNMYAVNQNTDDLEPMIELYVPNFVDSTGTSVLKTGRLNFWDTDGGLGQLRNNNLLFWSPTSTNAVSWFGTLGRDRGFTQLLGFDGEGNYTGGMLSGWFYDGLPHIWMEDGNENMGAHLHMPEGAGELILNGPNWNPNFAVGPKNWENGNLPHLRMNGQDEVEFLNDNGTPEDSTDDFMDSYIPDLVWMEIQKWEDGTEVGHLSIRSTDGTEFNISPYGIQTENLEVGNRGEGTYSQHRRDVFRIKNDNDQFSAVYLNRWDDGGARLQVSGHNENGENTGTFFAGASVDNGAYYYLYSPDETNQVRTGSYIQEGLPRFFMQGSFDVGGGLDSLGNPQDTLFYRPELVNLDVVHWENGTELGELTLRSTDGNEFRLNAYGIESPEINAGDIMRVGPNSDWNTNQINFAGGQDENGNIIDGGGSLGRKHWEGSSNGYLHINTEYGQKARLEGYNNDVEGWAGLSLDGASTNNIDMGAKDWEGADLAFLAMRGSTTALDENQNEYHPDLVWLETQRWENGTELGSITFNSTDGASLNVDAYGLHDADDVTSNNFSLIDGSGSFASNFGDGVTPNTSNGAQLALGGASQSHEVTIWGEFIDGAGQAKSHLSVNDG